MKLNGVSFKPWSHRANGRVTDIKSFYPFISVLCSFLIRWIRSLSGDVRWCPFRPVWSFEHVQNFPPNEPDRDARLMYGRYVASVRRDEFCHWITKFCMFCPFSLRNKSVCRSDQAFMPCLHCRSDQLDQTRSCGRGLIELVRRERSGRSTLVGITRASFPRIFDMSKILEKGSCSKKLGKPSRIKRESVE